MSHPLKAIFFVLYLLMGQHAFAQHDHSGDPEANWLQELGLYTGPYLFHSYKRYSAEDIPRFKQRVLDVRSDRSQSDWEGSYYFDHPDSVTFSQLTWNSKGFFSLAVFTCTPELQTLRYGSVESSNDAVVFLAQNSMEMGQPGKRFVKVRWGHRRYLVAEASLGAFAEKAAGRYLEPDQGDDPAYQLWSNYWVTSDKEEDPHPIGLPVFPLAYKHLERKPITARIARIGTREIRSEIEMGNRVLMGDSAVYTVAISAGSKAGLAPGITLVDPTTDEEVFLQTVNKTSATGILVRAIDDNRKDHCLTDDAVKMRCPALARGQLLSTKVGSFWW